MGRSARISIVPAFLLLAGVTCYGLMIGGEFSGAGESNTIIWTAQDDDKS